MPWLQAIIHKLYVNIWSTMIRLISVNVEISFRVLNDTRARAIDNYKSSGFVVVVVWGYGDGGLGNGYNSLSLCLPVCLRLCLSVCLSACLCLSVCLCLSIWLSVCLSVCLSLSLPICLPLSVCLSVSPSLSEERKKEKCRH